MNKYESINSAGKRRLGKGFSDYISGKLQDTGIKCWLKCYYNWILQVIKNSVIWHGIYNCINKSCNKEFKIVLIFGPNECQFDIYYDPKETNHMFIKNKICCRGRERIRQSFRLISSSSSKCQTDNSIFNKKNEKLGKLGF